MGSGTATVQDLLQNLSLHVQENKPVTYKWLAREYSLPSNYAKQLLFRYVQEHGSSVSAMYAVSGLLKATHGSAQHVFRLVPSSEVQTCRDQLQEGTISLHIHRCLPISVRSNHLLATCPDRWALSSPQITFFAV